MGNLVYAAANAYDIVELEERMRARDRDEVEASNGDVWKALEDSLRMSDDPVTLRDLQGNLVAIFGVAPCTLLSDTAAPWLLGTNLMQAYPKEVLRDARRYIAFARERYPRLVNYVDARNGPSIRWLRRIGFKIDPPAPFGVAGLPFHRFSMGLD